MTVGTVTRAHAYYGVASDTKPTDAPVGSTFYETDTGKLFHYNGAWVNAPDPVAGSVASGATDSGNPVKVGGKYNTTPPTLADGQRGDLQLSPYGQVHARIGAASTASDGVSNGNLMRPYTAQSSPASTGPMENAPYNFNGSTWDRQRGNAAATGLASGSRTASTQTPDQTNYNGKGVQVVLDVTATPNNAETLQVTVEAKDPVSGKYVQIAAFTALTASALGATPTTETYVYTLYPGAAETIATAKHELQALPVGRTWRVNVLHSAGGSWTYSVGVTNLT